MTKFKIYHEDAFVANYKMYAHDKILNDYMEMYTEGTGNFVFNHISKEELMLNSPTAKQK